MRRSGDTRKGSRRTSIGGLWRHHLDLAPFRGVRGFSGTLSAFSSPHSFHSIPHYTSHIPHPSSCSPRCSPLPWEDIAINDRAILEAV